MSEIVDETRSVASILDISGLSNEQKLKEIVVAMKTHGFDIEPRRLSPHEYDNREIVERREKQKRFDEYIERSVRTQRTRMKGR
jgi:hypothetical protein